MELSARSVDPLTIKTDCLIVPVGEDSKLSSATTAINKATGKLISRCQDNGDISGKFGSTLMLHEPPGLSAKRLLLVGVGKEAPNVEQFIKICQAATKGVSGKSIKTVATTLTQLKLARHDSGWAAAQLSRLFVEASYNFRKTGTKEQGKNSLKRVTVLCDDRKSLSSIKRGLSRAALLPPVLIAHDILVIYRVTPVHRHTSPARLVPWVENIPLLAPKYCRKNKCSNWAWARSCPSPPVQNKPHI